MLELVLLLVSVLRPVAAIGNAFVVGILLRRRRRRRRLCIHLLLRLILPRTAKHGVVVQLVIQLVLPARGGGGLAKEGGRGKALSWTEF
eukprot:SAG22_NODE_1555_length_4133_cov_3.586515_7_plen_89_part_00